MALPGLMMERSQTKTALPSILARIETVIAGEPGTPRVSRSGADSTGKLSSPAMAFVTFLSAASMKLRLVAAGESDCHE